MNPITPYSIRTKLLRRHYSGPGKSFMLSEDTYVNWVLMASETGSFQYRIADRTGEVHVGEIVLCPPGLTLYRTALSPLAFHFVEFSIEGLETLPDVQLPYGKISYINISRLLSTFECMRDAAILLSERYMEHLLEDLLFQCMKETIAGKAEHVPQEGGIRQAVQYIKQYAFEDISMQKLASRIGLSQSQFTRKFKAELGVSPIVYQTQIRLQKAKTLLLETHGSLQQIAEQCGYDNAFYFSRIFSKFIKMSPSVYRKSQRI